MRFPWNLESDLKRELAHHLYQLTAEYERRGHSHEEATWMAKREFGGSEQVKERCRDERRWTWMSGIWQDVAFALRQMRRSPGFAVTAVLTLALGIAANVVVFGVLQALVPMSLSFPRCGQNGGAGLPTRAGRPVRLALFATQLSGPTRTSAADQEVRPTKLSGIGH